MTWAELCALAGERLCAQPLASSIANIQARKGGDVLVSFYTSASKISPTSVMRGDGEYVGMVLWFPRDVVDKAFEKGGDNEGR